MEQEQQDYTSDQDQNQLQELQANNYVNQLDFQELIYGGDLICENVLIGNMKEDLGQNFQQLQNINNNQNDPDGDNQVHYQEYYQPEMELEIIQLPQDSAEDCYQQEEEEQQQQQHENLKQENQQEEENKIQQLQQQELYQQPLQIHDSHINNRNEIQFLQQGGNRFYNQLNYINNGDNQINQFISSFDGQNQVSDNDELPIGGQQLRSPLPQHLNQIYYKRKNNIDNSQKNYDLEKEPYIKLTLMKTNQSMEAQIQYIVTPKGMQDSQKNTDTEDIIIGRQQQSFFNDSKQEIHPNDIVLPANDRAISRIHCKIIYKHGFRVKRPIEDNLVQFLKLFHKRSESKWKQFPEYLLKVICQFIQPERKFYIVDIGSVYGTYIKVKPSKPQQIEKGQVFLIGADTLFNIVDVCWGTDYNNQKNQEFLNMLSNEEVEGTKIHGLKDNEESELSSLKMKKSDTFLNETQQFGQFCRPFVKLEIQIATNVAKHIFVAEMNNYKEKQEYKIGRSQECNIVINQNTISRKQSRVYYENNKWYLSDGDRVGEQIRESANGTWISLTDYFEKKNQNSQRVESDHKEIENDTEIKISDSILKIQIFNNYPKKNKQTYYSEEEQYQQNNKQLLLQQQQQQQQMQNNSQQFNSTL